ncbi:MAG: hypothetical protein K6U02_09860 [Firmicutes bacterium]|nr:hypothetical protein [Bacillota bacterium]
MMVLRLNQDVTVENPRQHAAEDVAVVRNLLTAGAIARPDPQRVNFYELEAGNRVFYIHISPVTGHVLLLASWTADPGPRQAATGA